MNEINLVGRNHGEFAKEAVKFMEEIGVNFTLVTDNPCREVVIKGCTLCALRLPKPEKIKIQYPEDVKFSYYGRTGDCANHNGIIVVCCSINETHNTITYGVAYCSPEDVYNKETGKSIAYNDMEINQNTLDLVKKSHHDINSRIFADMIAMNDAPSWAKNKVAVQLVRHLLHAFDLDEY